ncbi:proteasome subunit beta type-6-B like protein-like, partial [Clupea harengus]|uniref:Proteasome subunit beta type-6-B like protein-like n=1 Tax=Clupea harengus TaxID=7950 RepID=A0A8M1KHY8_CLUHA
LIAFFPFQTTILAVRFNGGVIIGSDSRASIGGSYVSSKTINKLIQVHERIFCCIAGSKIFQQVSPGCIQMGSPPLVKAAASVMKELCYRSKEEPQAGFITTGWDRRNGPQVSPLSLGGMLLCQHFTIGGSGSTYIYGYADAKYKPDMNREEFLQFPTNVKQSAIGRDNVSGGVVHLVVITEDGVEHVFIPGDKLPKYHDE